MLTRARMVSLIAFGVSATAAVVTGCGLFVDFSPYDTSAIPPEAAAEDGSIFDAGPPFVIAAVAPDPASWRGGSSVAVHVSVLRGAHFIDKLALTATQLPSGVAVVSGSIPAGATSGDLVLSAATSVHAGLFHGAKLVVSTPNGVTQEHPLDIELTGAPGAPDESFGDGGVTALPLRAESAVLSADDDIVVIGDLQDAGPVAPVVVRFSPAGTLDLTFGDGGFSVPIAGNGGFGNGLARDDAGYVVVETPSGLNGRRSVARIDLGGTPLPNFGEGGTIEYTNKNNAVIASGPAAGTVFLAGTGAIGSYTVDWFTKDGTVAAHAVGFGKELNMVVDGEGRAVVLSHGVHLTRLFADGSVDSTLTDPSDAAVGLGLGTTAGLLATSDSYFVTGTLSPYDIVKLRIDGTPDPTFGNGGFATETVDQFAAADAGALYVSRGVAVGRLNAQGGADLTFGSGADTSDAPVKILVQRSGRIVVVGTKSIHRYWP